MPYMIQAVVNIVSLLIGIAMVLWGLRIFKFYIILTGIAVGAVLGVLAGGLVFGSLEAAVLGGVIGAILGGVIAWPLQKFFVFLIAGAWSGLLGAAAMAAMGVPQDALWVVGLILFVAGGALAVCFYEYVIIIVMAFSGVQAIFNAVFVPHAAISGEDPAELWRYLLQAYSERIVTLLFLVVVFIGFALYFQKRAIIKSGYDERTKWTVAGLRRLSYLLSLLAVLGFALMHFIGEDFSGSILFGSNIFSWPLTALAAASFSAWLVWSGDRVCFLKSRAFCRFLYMLLFSLVVLPLITWCVNCVLFLQPIRLWYYLAFFDGPPVFLVTKWVCAMLVVPGLLYWAALRESAPAAAEIPETQDTGKAEQPPEREREDN